MKTACLTLAVAFAATVFAQEHPEHPKPKSDAKQEHSSHTYSMDELEKAITNEIVTAQEKNDDSYTMKDTETNQTLKMKLDHVHRERLAKLDPKTYFACTDFKTDDGHTVDVDFFMKDDGEKLVMSDATIHKIDGKARYNWQEKDGYWVRVPVEK
jgi:actin-related protein